MLTQPAVPHHSTEHLTARQARLIALAAQGFASDRPTNPTVHDLLGVVDRLGAIQIDSVNVLSRAHYLPFFSRLGAYDRGILDRAMGGDVPTSADSPGGRRPGKCRADLAAANLGQQLFEYWAHEASIVRPATLRMLRWRMARWGNGASYRDQWAAEHPGLLGEMVSLVRQRGPLTVGQLRAAREAIQAQSQARVQAQPSTAKRTWWGNWPPEKMASELLFGRGIVTSAGRTAQFERRFVLPERVLPAEVLASEDPPEEEAFTELIRIAAKAHGVATDRDLQDYFRLSRVDAATGIRALAGSGELLPVTIEGVRRPAWLHRDAQRPRRVQARALLAPFDPLIWERSRLLELFGVHYRIEIYVPRQQRRFGYYVLPFLLGDQIVARVDLKADRDAGVLRVQAAHAEGRAQAAQAGRRVEAARSARSARAEHHASPRQVAFELAGELRLLSAWLGLGPVEVADRGDLAPALTAEVHQP